MLLLIRSFLCFCFQAQEFRCQATCYENERIPDNQLENCGNNCSMPVQRFIQFVNKEYSGVVVGNFSHYINITIIKN